MGSSALELRRLIRSFCVLKSHGRLCHRQDNTAAIGLDEAAEEDRERSARSARVGVGEELEGEGEG